MAYVKTFRIFEAEAINEAEGFNIKGVKPEFKKMITAEVKKLSDEDKKKLASDMGSLAAKLNLTVADLEDHNKVAMALLNAGMITENFSFSGDEDQLIEDLNEGLGEAMDKFKAWWEKTKMKVYKWMVKLGVGSAAGGILTAAIGAGFMPEPNYSGPPVTPNAAVIAGGVAAAVGVVSLILGLKGTGDLAEVAKAASNARSGR
jgi:hypothetical protein